MNENSTNTELLIRYLDGELEGKDLEQLEQKLAEDAALLQELENLRTARDAVRSFALKNRVNELHRQMIPGLQLDKRQGILRTLARNSLKVAATVIIIFLAVGIYQYNSLSPGKVFESNYQPYALRESRGDQNISSIETAYKKNQFAGVIELFEQLKEPTISDYFFAGNAYLRDNQANKATRCFSTILQKDKQLGKNDLQDDAEYYLAMSYLKNNEIDQALPIFEKIHNDNDHLYHDHVSKWFLRKLHWLK